MRSVTAVRGVTVIQSDGGKDDVRRESDSSTGGNNALVKEISQCGGVCGEL